MKLKLKNSFFFLSRFTFFGQLLLSILLVGSSFLVEQIAPNLISMANAQMPSGSGVVNTSDWFEVPRTGLMYQSQTGRCVTRRWNVELQTFDRIVQDLSSCRRTWYAIVRAGPNEVLFYDRSAGDIEIYSYSNERGIEERLHRYSGTARRTWREISTRVSMLYINPGRQDTYHIEFQDDNGQRETYRYSRDRGLFRD